MPRTDRTFSDTDLIRIFSFHLTPEEQNNVLNQLCGAIEPPEEGEPPNLVRVLENVKTALEILNFIIEIFPRNNPILVLTGTLLDAMINLLEITIRILED